jgi:hypothetical protein
MNSKASIFSSILAVVLASGVSIYPAQVAKNQLEPAVVSFLKKHAVAPEIQAKLEKIFDAQTQWELLAFLSYGDPSEYEKTLSKKGFVFPSARYDTVIKHKDIERKIIKLPKKSGALISDVDLRLHKNLCQYNAGRIKYSLDLQDKIKANSEQVSQLLNYYKLPQKITFPEKWAVFIPNPIANFCSVIILAEELDLAPLAKFTRQQWTGIQRLAELIKYEDIPQKPLPLQFNNIIMRSAPYNDLVFMDTEPQTAP